MDDSEDTPRRGTRLKKPSIKALETLSIEDSSDEANTKRKTRQIKKVNKNILSESDDDPFADSGSEFDGDESTASDSSSDKSTSSSNSPIIKPKSIKSVVNTFKNKRRVNQKYTINTDDYFTNNSTKKIFTSNNTLEKLETPRLGQDLLQELLKKSNVSKEHEKCMGKILKQNRKMFSKWFCILHENYNVLLYGLGSKRDIIQQFQNEYLQHDPVIVINGFFPTLSIKDVLDGILIDLLELKKSPGNIFEACKTITEEINKYPDLHIYLIVHNIDGVMLRNNKAQSVLSQLAASPKIHLIASIDHINAPLIWDHPKLNKFNYTWWDMTSFLPYIDETSFESSIMIKGKGEFVLSSLRNVFLSLTSNAKGIYMKIIKHQLDNSSNQNYEGFSFKDLYWACREDFLVSSDLALRAQLTEFLDHKILKFKRSLNGVEYVVIPLANLLLQKFLDEQS